MHQTKHKNRTLKKIHPTQLKFSILQFLFWATYAAYTPFIVVILQEKGFNNTVIGAILSVNSFIVVLAQPLWGLVSDWIRSVRKIFLLCFTVAIILFQSIPFVHSVLFTGIIFALFTFFESPLSPLLDSWIIQSIREEASIPYGSIRLWGSIGYAVLCLVFSKVLNHTSINVLFPSFAAIGICTMLISSRINEDNPVSTAMAAKDLKVGRLLKNYRYLAFLLFSVVIYIPHKASSSFLPNLIESVGGTKADVALASSLTAFAEVPMFLMNTKLLKKFKPTQLILASAVFFILRQIGCLVAATPAQVILVQILNGAAFALFLNGAVYYIDSLAPDELKATAQTVATSLYVGASGIISSYGGGWVIDNLGLAALHRAGAYISLGITALFVASFHIIDKIEQRNRKTQEAAVESYKQV